MGKRKSAKKKSPARTAGGATTSRTYGGGGGYNNPKFSAFDFTDDDLRVEIDAHKALEKFGTKSPKMKTGNRRQARQVDKYTFLEMFAQGQQKNLGSGMSDVEGTENNPKDISFGTDLTMSPAPRSRKPGCFTAGKHNNILYVDSDQDGNMDLGSSRSEDEGPLKDRSIEDGADNNECEAVVAVAPYYVKCGKMFYTRCLLFFSRKTIRLKGSPLCDRKTTRFLEWSTFDIIKIESQQLESGKAEVVCLNMKSESAVGKTGDWNSGSAELEFVIHDDPQWSVKQEEIKSLGLKFKDAWEIKLRECSLKESFVNLVYPDGDPDAIFLSRRDIDLLQPGAFMNDTIIDFYLKYLSNQIKPEERYKFHFFNTFFFQKLDALFRDSSSVREGGYCFQSIHKWTRNVNIFETEYIFLPVNFSLHWSLIIICHPGEVTNLRDNVMDGSPKVPCILHMDSIRGSHKGLENLIRHYLWEEWKERGNNHEEDFSAKFLNMKFVSLQLPQQENWFDCGLFLLHYAELFLKLASNLSISECFGILNQDWFLPAEVSIRKRDHIKKVILRIVEDTLKDPPAAHDDKYLQSYGLNEECSSVKIIQNNGVKESCSGVEFNSSDDLYTMRHQYCTPMLEQSSGKSTTDEGFHPCKLQPPINQFSNLSLPLEEAIKKQAASQEDEASSRHVDTPQPSNFRTGKMKDSFKTCKINFDNSLVIIEESASPGKRNKEVAACVVEDSDEDFSTCIVEDSEDENRSQSMRKTRRGFFMTSACHDV